MRKAVYILIAIGALAIPAPASALWAGNLHVEATLSGITYEVEVCGAAHRLVRLEGLYGEVGNPRTYVSRFYDHQRYNCATWELSEETPMWEGQWDAVFYVYSRGHHAHTGDVEFTV